MSENDRAVELVDITKTFPGVIANDKVNLSVALAEIHAIVGENGAGKSTLMNMLYGMLTPDSGEILVRGQVERFHSPKDAIGHGIGMVHQHFMLADNLTVLENIVLGFEPKSGVTIDFKGARETILELGSRYGMSIDPNTLVEKLSVGQRQRVEILKVLFRGASILILDEPTAVLVPQEVDELFDNLKVLRDDGVTLIFISHKLDEVLSVADSITVMRGGKTVTTVLPADVDAGQLAELMVGSELPSPDTTESTVTDQVVLRVENLAYRAPDGRALLDDVSFTIHNGEIIGIAGVEGNGQSELIDALMGVVEPDSGTVELDGTDISGASTMDRHEAGLGIIPEDRHRQGLLLNAPLWENVMLGHQSQVPFARGPFIDMKGTRNATEEVVRRFNVKTPNINVPALALSGGNQQKLIVGKEMLAKPDVLIAAHPTRGIDVGAQAAIWDELREARREGLAVLLISADLDELIGLSDTLLVIFDGKIVASLDPAEVTPEILGSYMTGVAQDVAS
ncbi:MAG: ABC transporter ATP-binding protein [Acidimicrobiia bacterium]|nr:MAG: ABC transporter ATP-binding protein [Acidimicrobiia bacterium]